MNNLLPGQVQALKNFFQSQIGSISKYDHLNGTIKFEFGQNPQQEIPKHRKIRDKSKYTHLIRFFPQF